MNVLVKTQKSAAMKIAIKKTKVLIMNFQNLKIQKNQKKKKKKKKLIQKSMKI